MILAVDTSTSVASLALVERDRLLAELTWRSEQNQTVELMPNIDHLCRLARSDAGSIKLIVAARGPGSFNGVRVGLSAAKGLALALGTPIVGVSSLEAEAFVHAGASLPIRAVFKAGRAEVATALFRSGEGPWTRVQDERIATLAGIRDEVSEKTLFCGEIDAADRDLLKAGLRDLAVFPQEAANVRRAAFLARLGLQYFEDGQSDDPATLQPIYLRRPPITQPKPALWRVKNAA